MPDDVKGVMAAHDAGEKVEHQAMKRGVKHGAAERLERKTMRKALRKSGETLMPTMIIIGGGDGDKDQARDLLRSKVGRNPVTPSSSGAVEKAARNVPLHLNTGYKTEEDTKGKKWSPDKGRYEPLDEKVDSRLMRPDTKAPMARGDDYYETKERGRMERKATRGLRRHSR